MNEAHFYKIARQISKKADYTGSGKAKLGCIVVYKNAILAKGCNTDKTHTTQRIWNIKRFQEGNHYVPSKCHAEINCLTKIKYLDIDFSRIHLFIYRELKDGRLAMSRPCASCLAAIRDMGIRHIHYTTDLGYAYERLETEV